MASSSAGKRSVPKRMTALQAADLFARLGDSDSEFSSSDDENEIDLARDFQIQQQDLSESQSSDDDDGRGASPRPGPSHSKAKRSRVQPSQSRSSAPDNDENWTVINRSDILNKETTNNFRFIPKNGNQPGVNTALINETSSVLDCFNALISDDLCDLLLTSINEYAAEKVMRNTPARKRSLYGSWKPITKYELLKLFAVFTAMGLDPRPYVRDYHSTEKSLYTEFYHTMFDRERLEVLYHTMLHVGEPNTVGKNKIEPFVNVLIEKFNNAFTPFQNVSIDEMIIGWKGRWQYKQFNASKPHKYHIKSFGLVDSSTGYVLNLLTYYGANTSYDPETNTDAKGRTAVKIFDTLLQPIGVGHHIFADRWYTTKVLVERMLETRQYYTGTLQQNRVGFPVELKTKKCILQHLESKYWMSNDCKILCLAHRDKKAKKQVVMVSTKGYVDEPVENGGKVKPAVIDQYNFNMNGCDKADQMIGYYGLQKRKTTKWWKKIFYWIFEIASMNAFILYRLSKPDFPKKYGLKKFKHTLVNELCEAASAIMPDDIQQASKKVGRPRTSNPIDRLEGGRHIVAHNAQDRRCRVCSRPNNVKRTNFYCKGCVDRPHLHPKHCFEIWHTDPNL